MKHVVKGLLLSALALLPLSLTVMTPVRAAAEEIPQARKVDKVAEIFWKELEGSDENRIKIINVILDKSNLSFAGDKNAITRAIVSGHDGMDAAGLEKMFQRKASLPTNNEDIVKIVAACYNDQALLEPLTKRGLKVNVRDSRGDNALDYFVGDPENSRILYDGDVSRFETLGMKPDARTISVLVLRSPPRYGSEKGVFDLMDRIIADPQFDPNYKYQKGNTLLHYIASTYYRSPGLDADETVDSHAMKFAQGILQHPKVKLLQNDQKQNPLHLVHSYRLAEQIITKFPTAISEHDEAGNTPALNLLVKNFEGPRADYPNGELLNLLRLLIGNGSSVNDVNKAGQNITLNLLYNIDHREYEMSRQASYILTSLWREGNFRKILADAGSQAHYSAQVKTLAVLKKMISSTDPAEGFQKIYDRDRDHKYELISALEDIYAKVEQSVKAHDYRKILQARGIDLKDLSESDIITLGESLAP